MSSRRGESAEPAGSGPHRRPTPREAVVGLAITIIVVVVGGSAGALVASISAPPGRPSVSPPATTSTTAASAGVQSGDFRFLPALTTPPVQPAPSTAPPPVPVAPATIAVRLVESGAAATNGALVSVSWAGADEKPLPESVSIKAGVDAQSLKKVSIGRDATGLTRAVEIGHDYVYRLEVPASGAAPAMSTTSAFRLRSIDDSGAGVTYDGRWSEAGFPRYLGRSARYSTRPGASVTLTFIGRSVAWVGPVGPGRGKATIEVDGKTVATRSLIASRYHPRQVLFARSWPDVGRHTLRVTVAASGGGAVMVDSFAVIGPPATEPPPDAVPPVAPPTLPDGKLPIRAAFYYGWYPEAWAQNGSEAWTRFHPVLGTYDSSNAAPVAAQIEAMRFGGIDAAIASWWGPGTRTDGRLPRLLTAARGTGLSWALIDEVEQVADPDSAAIGLNLGYIRDHFANDPAYLRIDGRFVVFVGAGPDDGCDLPRRWTTANADRAFLVLPAVPGHAGCASQPDLWYASDPTLADQQIGESSYSISPGFWRLGESARLDRDPARWAASIRSMVASGASLQLINSFNHWGDGSSVESAAEWASSSGFGAFLDALRANGIVAGGQASAPPSSPVPGPTDSDPVLVGAGAIASCGRQDDEATAQILSTVQGTVFTVGDHAYDSGTLEEFRNCYAPSWGAFLDRTRPSAGNRDYSTTGAAGYFAYFGSAAGAPDKGYYAYDIGRWRIYVLNSNCSKVGGCDVGSPQEAWLRADLESHPNACIGAYWHAARFSSGRFTDDVRLQPFWQALYDHGAEFVISGHDHNYQRYAPLTPDGRLDRTRGIREFIVGTGGNGHTALSGSAPNREAGNDQAYGVLRLTLRPTGYEWQFLATSRAAYDDSGAESCH